MANEPVAVADVLSELKGQWNSSNVTEPRVVEVNNSGSATQSIRVDLNQADHVIGRAGTPAFQEVPIGNWKYGNRTYTVDLEVYTRQSRLNLYNLVREIRRICHARMHSLTNFQRIRFVRFSENTESQVNVWTGTIIIQLENNAILLETT